ncbi:MAG: NADPH-dependent 7-cyano-7-deazaguanine reductase QueF [Candidatus Marinimicrobia bacterium]|nr:NADPH-dependent 7-cyano-7-deazaguanine reductase QueF [Candidatus Neomarinimicrobiota bacterium]MBL7108731.1 NADPH-dependent 7-cyano-7-deazaguanine reductase QueF [Candidatus Neomarinimicrobiota bacterium]
MNNPTYKDLEIVENQYPDRDYEVKVSIPEFNCVCPKTGLPDFAEISINYIPDKHIVELKSLKLYIVKFRNIGIFHEEVTNRIMDDFYKASSPRKIEVIGNFHSRGGISTIVTTRKPQK